MARALRQLPMAKAVAGIAGGVAAITGCAQPPVMLGTTTAAEVADDTDNLSDSSPVPVDSAQVAPDTDLVASEPSDADAGDAGEATTVAASAGPLPIDVTGCEASYLGEPPSGNCPVFIRHWSCPQPASFVAAARAADGGFAMAGRVGPEAWIVRTASDGKPLWQRRFASPSQADDLVATSDGGWVAVGAVGESSFVARFDTNGIIAWSIGLDGSATKVVQLAGGGFAVASYSFTGKSALTLVRIDASGAVLGATSHKLYQGGWINSLARRPDGSLGLAYSQKTGAGTYGGVLWNFDAAGLPADQTAACSEAILHPLADGTMLVGCNTYAPGSGIFASFVERSDQAGVQWRTFVSSWGKNLLAFWDTTAFDAFADGSSMIGSAHGEVRWSRIGADGHLAWQREAAVAADLLTLPDGGFAAVGFAGEATQAVATLVRADRWGHAQCAAATGCSALPLDACNDGNGCTSDYCVGKGSCTHVPLDDYTPCGSGAAKSQFWPTSACIGGVCKANAW